RGRHPPGRDAEGRTDVPDHRAELGGRQDDAAARETLRPACIRTRLCRAWGPSRRRRAQRRVPPVQGARRRRPRRRARRRLPGGAGVSRTAAVACLTGAGTAPEWMAEAVLALDAVGRLHGLQIDDTHVSFGGVALARAGQAVPAATRAVFLGADAFRVAGGGEPALDEVMSELDLRAELTCVRFGSDGALAFVTPLEESATEWAVEVAVRIAESRSMRLSSVGDAPWNDVVDEVASRHEHVRVEHL